MSYASMPTCDRVGRGEGAIGSGGRRWVVVCGQRRGGLLCGATVAKGQGRSNLCPEGCTPRAAGLPAERCLGAGAGAVRPLLCPATRTPTHQPYRLASIHLAASSRLASTHLAALQAGQHPLNSLFKAGQHPPGGTAG